MDLKSLKVFLVFLVFTIMGCASYQPPAELIMAEKAFSEARTSQAGKYAPVEFYEAEKSLGKAKESLKSKENMSTVKLYAYQAQRKAEVAKATVAGDIPPTVAGEANARRVCLNSSAVLKRLSASYSTDFITTASSASDISGLSARTGRS